MPPGCHGLPRARPLRDVHVSISAFSASQTWEACQLPSGENNVTHLCEGRVLKTVSLDPLN